MNGTTLGRPPLGAVSLGANADGSTDDANLMAAGNAVQAIDPCNPLVNPTVSAFQSAWNATSDSAMGQPQLKVDGKYGPKTVAALAQIYGDSGVNVQGPCPQFAGGGGGPSPSPSPGPSPAPGPITPVPAPGALSTGLPTWAKWLLGGLIAAAVIFVGYVLMHPKHRAKAAGHARRAGRAIKHHARRLTGHRVGDALGEVPLTAHESRRRRRRRK